MGAVSHLNSRELRFPSIAEALEDPDGLLAVGGDLSSERLLLAYRSGIFPWYDEEQPILWWSPDPRAVIYPDRLHISRSLKKALRKEYWQVTSDTAFTEVIEGCAALDEDRTGTWITDEMQAAYTRLFEQGWAHSIEVREQGELIGGMYGIAINRLFFGESMFSRSSNASKIGLAVLAHHLRTQGYKLIDCQVGNPHLYSMGAEDLPRQEFAEILSAEYADTIDPPARWQWSYTAKDLPGIAANNDR